MDLTCIGFNTNIQSNIDIKKQNEYQLARIITVNKDNYIVSNGESEISAEVTGNLMFRADSPIDYPTVGDWVYVQYYDNATLAIIYDIVPRYSVLKRKAAGKKIEFQLIAANIDTAFIIQSLDGNYNLRRLERYLAMIIDACIQPVILLSKCDILPSGEIQEIISGLSVQYHDIPVITLSNITGEGLDQLKICLKEGSTYCLLGSSGVGKTTLINRLIGEERYETREVREKDHRGKHTTTTRQLIKLASGALLIDTPGMRELASFEIEEGLSATFDEISELAEQCRFSDCSHSSEKGCAILHALELGQISQERYNNYMKINKENAYFQRSYLEKRQRDKEFGKMCKSIMKNHKKKNY